MAEAAPPSLSAFSHDKLLIVDFGSQVTQLIARRVREAGVYCEVAPFQSAEAAFDALKPKAVILSGGPASVPDEGSPRAPQAIFEAGVPVLGICYGQTPAPARRLRRSPAGARGAPLVGHRGGPRDHRLGLQRVEGGFGALERRDLAIDPASRTRRAISCVTCDRNRRSAACRVGKCGKARGAQLRPWWQLGGG